VDKKHDIPAEARNIVFMSSLAMNGEGRGIVIRTGTPPGCCLALADRGKAWQLRAVTPTASATSGQQG
jgi:hypothetical protein